MVEEDIPRRDPTADLVGAGAAPKLLPADLRASYAEVRRKPGSALIRIISAREATNKERQQYEAG